MQLVSKLAVKKICGTINPKSIDTKKLLCTIIGSVVGSKIVSTTYGDSTAFMGTFEGTNLDTGETFKSNVCYLPSIAEVPLAVAVAKIKESEKIINFACKIGVMPADTQVGYEYFIEYNTSDDDLSDPLAESRQLLDKTSKPKLVKSKK